jgi:PhzF family phenazine biosynthesis protein
MWWPRVGKLARIGTVAFLFQQVDVFTTVALRGNPVAVVLDALGVDTATMQAFAAWTNLSETTYILPGDDEADYRVRIFTPAAELPFAGHPTLGSCHAWLIAGGIPRDPEMIIQRCDAGLVRVRRDATGLAFAAPPLVRSGPVEALPRARLASLLRLRPEEILDAQWVDNGPGWVAVLLASAEAVLAVRRPARAEFAELAGLAGSDGTASPGVGVVGPYPPGEPATFEVRAFTPLLGAVEDPVTGSLNASLAQWLIGSGRASAPYVVSQGGALGRAGRVMISRDDTAIWVGGGTITTISGTVDI